MQQPAKNNSYRGQNRGSFNSNNRDQGRGRGGHEHQQKQPPPENHPNSGEGAIFPLTIKPGSRAFRYDFVIRYDYKKMDFKTKELVDESLVFTAEKSSAAIRQLCYHVFKKIKDDPNNISPDIAVVYNGTAAVFSNKPLQLIEREFQKSDFPEELQQVLKGDGTVYVSIHPNERAPDLALDDLEQYKLGELLVTEDRTLRTTLEVITAQKARLSGVYTPIGAGQLYRNQEELLRNGFTTRVGAYVGVKMVETTDTATDSKTIQPAIVLDIKKSLFYKKGNFLEAILEFINSCRESDRWAAAEKAFKGVRVSPTYDRRRTLTFFEFTDRPVKDIKFPQENGEQISMIEYYAQSKNIILQHTGYRAAKCGNAGQFPMELLDILPDQKVDLDVIPPKIRDFVHKENAVRPHLRHDKIMDEFRRIFGENELATKFGVAIADTPHTEGTLLDFGYLQKPQILLGGGRKAFPDEDGRFKIGGNQYFKTGTVKKWTLLVSNAAEIDQNACRQFVEKLIYSGKEHGMTFESAPEFEGIDSNDLAFPPWAAVFTKIQKSGSKFVLYICETTDGNHGMLKLMETRFKIITQQISYQTVKSIVDRRGFNPNLENFLLKVNLKSGGISYKPEMNKTVGRLDINKGNLLVLGYDVCHSKGASESTDPSVVGITFNNGPDPFNILGDFFYQKSRTESVDSAELKLYMKKILEQWRKNRGKQLPETVVVLRDGISEGQFLMACESELPALRAGCYAFDADYRPKFLFIVATKEHHKRFFDLQNGQVQNPGSGSCVDNDVVRPDCLEFYIKAHKTIQGSAKFVQVAVLVNELNATNEEIKNFVHCSCYGHQVVTSPTSLPTSIYIADDLAERGAEIFQSFKRTCPDNVPWVDKALKNELDYKLLTKMLNYSESALSNIRFNA